MLEIIPMIIKDIETSINENPEILTFLKDIILVISRIGPNLSFAHYEK